jgi:hypothetical protein
MRSLPPPVALLLAAALGVTACAGMVDPAVKADLDRRVAAFPTSEETYPPSDVFSPMSFHPGQWTQHRIRDDKNGPQLLTFKLLGMDSGGYWVETVNESYAGREAIRMLVFLRGGRDTSAMEIRGVRIKKGDGPAVDLDQTADPTARNRVYQALDLLAVAMESQEKDDARVPGGHFIGCWKHQTPGPWGPWQKPSIVCAHPSVPLSGIVFAKPTDGSALMELVAWGTSGAEPEL